MQRRKSAKIRTMAAKKAKTRAKKERPERREPAAGQAIELIATALAGHDAAIQQLAEVVVNLHANIRAIREVVEALAEATSEPRVAEARARLRRVKLDE
jgi:hypothetical protein